MYGLKCVSVESLQANQHAYMWTHIHNSCLNGRNHSGISVSVSAGRRCNRYLKEMWCERMNWIHLAHERGYWPDAVNTVSKCRVRYRARNFVISWATSSLTSQGVCAACEGIWTTLLCYTPIKQSFRTVIGLNGNRSYAICMFGIKLAEPRVSWPSPLISGQADND
jgi:hypothetical protein